MAIYLNTILKNYLIFGFALAIFVVLLFNSIFNTEFVDFLTFFYGDILFGDKSNQINLMDFFKILLILIIEISLIGSFFSFIIKKLFN
ncbi:hypothetical protein VAMP_13n86 [Candidatus Vampirococcus lugosii]|uniref:Uncharacterized protein n=1 Tax=Candidatus Vampirococcus lugosii TaxID=2789015 RepID=A0ABS5QKC6_9BACT|nr:hypothetical protein [Candidatus Vampirococcus lugosii]